MKVERGVPLARLTTIGTGGPARLLARPATVDELVEALRLADAEGLDVEVVGLGSNLLAADAGVDALVVRLEGDLARVEVDAGAALVVAGGGAANAVILHRVRDAGLAGFEFACAIPGTAGGGIRMNAGAYGRDWRDVTKRALLVDSGGPRWVSAPELGLDYRTSALPPRTVVALVELAVEPGDPADIRALVADLHRRRKATQPTNTRTFGSVFKNPDHEFGAGRMLELCGLKGFASGGARISSLHANFIENAGGATSADAIALMVEARRRAFEEFGVVLEHEVRLVGGLALPPL